jgi:hypothetical protein
MLDIIWSLISPQKRPKTWKSRDVQILTFQLFLTLRLFYEMRASTRHGQVDHNVSIRQQVSAYVSMRHFVQCCQTILYCMMIVDQLRCTLACLPRDMSFVLTLGLACSQQEYYRGLVSTGLGCPVDLVAGLPSKRTGSRRETDTTRVIETSEWLNPSYQYERHTFGG